MEPKAKRQKQFQKIAQNPKNIRFEDLRRLLEVYGFEQKRSKGSHHAFVGKLGEQKLTIVVPFRRPLKEIYVKNALALLSQIDEAEQDTSQETDDVTPSDT